jgi:phosphohistidine phosphatase
MASHLMLYLVRHAIAEEAGSAWPDDDERPLSAEGRKKWRRAVAGLRVLLPPIDLVLTSPLRRARQTADLLAAGLAGPPPVENLDVLRPETTPQAVLKKLRQRSLSGHVVLVGHEPSIARLAGTLLDAQAAIEFRKGAVMAVWSQGLGTRGPGRLDWYATPRMLRAIAADGKR